MQISSRDHKRCDRDTSGPRSECEAGGRREVEIPRLNSIVHIDQLLLGMLGVAYGRLVLASIAPPFTLFLMPNENGVPGLLELDHWTRLKRSGSELPKATAAEKIILQCDLEAAGVPNGATPIAIWQHPSWSPDLIARYGETDNPHTSRRWRARRAAPPG